MKNKALGAEGEDMAVKFLKKKGLKILERNLRTPFGEIDIIAKDGGTVVFIEVKTRLSDYFGHPAEAVGYRKKKHIERAALYYLSARRHNAAARFDVISIIMRPGAGEAIEHIKDAFEAAL
ncbi:MAG: YraN family protein [Thermodesulfovibrionales bacterium]|nr:YraN family protein [Thermodesulfovibrionales bacterium]